MLKWSTSCAARSPMPAACRRMSVQCGTAGGPPRPLPDGRSARPCYPGRASVGAAVAQALVIRGHQSDCRRVHPARSARERVGLPAAVSQL